MSEQFKSNLESILDYLGVGSDEQTKEKIGSLLNEKSESSAGGSYRQR